MHTVAYLWKAGKPRWQTVWYVAIKSGGGGCWEGLAETICEAGGRAWKGVSSFAAAEPARKAATDGWPGVVPAQGGKRLVYKLSTATNPQIQGKILEACVLNPLSLVLVSSTSSLPILSSVALWPHLCWPTWSPELTCHVLPTFYSLQSLLPSLPFFKLSWVSVSQVWSCLWLLS